MLYYQKLRNKHYLWINHVHFLAFENDDMQQKKKNFKLFLLEIHFETTVIVILVPNCISKTIFFLK